MRSAPHAADHGSGEWPVLACARPTAAATIAAHAPLKFGAELLGLLSFEPAPGPARPIVWRDRAAERATSAGLGLGFVAAHVSRCAGTDGLASTRLARGGDVPAGLRALEAVNASVVRLVEEIDQGFGDDRPDAFDRRQLGLGTLAGRRVLKRPDASERLHQILRGHRADVSDAETE